jgi:hypothetical protein
VVQARVVAEFAASRPASTDRPQCERGAVCAELTCVLPNPVTIRSRPARPGVAAPPAGTAGDPSGEEARVDWIVLVVLLALAAALAGQGARLVARGRRAADADPEAGTDRAVLSLVLVGVALGIAATGAAVAAAGSPGPVQAAVFLAAAVAVGLPVAAVWRGTRRG